MIQSYKVAGMTCNGCVQIVQDSLSKIAGVMAVNVNYQDDTRTCGASCIRGVGRKRYKSNIFRR